ncbi:MAG: M28 family peptidase, partial [Gemmatimonadaceae bacterium]
DVTAIGTRFPVAGRVQNVLVRLKGSSSRSRAVLLVAHYDGVAAGPAAGDDASGTAALLETLRALGAGPQLRNDVIFLFADAEEDGLLGAAAFVREHPWSPDVGVVMNFEARGTHGPSLMFQTGDGNLDVVRALRSAPDASATSLSVTVYRRLPNDTDLSELALLKTPALNFAFIGGVNRYHTLEDDVAHLSPASLQHHGEQALALARRFASEPLPRPATPDAVFFRAPLLGLVAYPEGWAIPVVILALVAFAVASERARRREPRWFRDTAIGALATLLTVGVSAVAVTAITHTIQVFHGARPLGGDPTWSSTYALALALLVVSIVAATYSLVRRWASAAGTHSGAMLIWALLAMLLTLLVPGGSFLFVWPLLLAAAAAAVEGPAMNPRIAAAVSWVATFFVLFIIVPTTYLTVCVALGLNATGAPLLGILVSLTAWLLAPHLETLRGTRPIVAPLVLDAIVVVLIVLGLTRERTTPGNPTAASFIYAVDADSNKAWLTSTASSPSARTWTREALAQASAGRPQESRPTWVMRSFDPARTFTAPMVAQLASPSATVMRDSTAGGTRSITYRVRGGRGARAVLVSPVNATVTAAFIDGKRVQTDRYRQGQRPWPIEYVALTDSGFVLTLEMQSGTNPVLAIMSRLDSFPPLPGFRMPRRPPGILPIQAGDGTLVYRRVTITR